MNLRCVYIGIIGIIRSIDLNLLSEGDVERAILTTNRVWKEVLSRYGLFVIRRTIRLLLFFLLLFIHNGIIKVYLYYVTNFYSKKCRNVYFFPQKLAGILSK